MGSKRIGLARVKSLINENGNQMKFQAKEVVHVNNTATTLTAKQSGATVFWTHGSVHNITLPAATPGMNFKIILTVGSAHAQNIAAASGDGFYGKVTVTKSAGTDKNATQTVVKGSATDYIKLHTSTTTLGGNAGDVIELVCLTKGFWLVDARLSSTGNPGSTAVLAD
tara:strand:+ start:414 stop:917 length:504 start_codon:yes stop_codon:yes gene_type:complete